jgi:hypothetical protein
MKMMLDVVDAFKNLSIKFVLPTKRSETGGSQKKARTSSHHPLAAALLGVVMSSIERPDQ